MSSGKDDLTFKDILRRPEGVCVAKLPDARNKSRILRQEINAHNQDVLLMQPKKHDPEIPLSNIIAVFPSKEFENGLVLLALSPTPVRSKAALQVSFWRFRIHSGSIATHEQAIQYLATVTSFNDGSFGPNNINETINSVVETYETLAAHAENLPYLKDGVHACMEVAAKIGETAPYLGPAFSLLHFALTTHENVQTNKADLIDLLDTWEKLEAHLEESIGQKILSLAENYFSIPSVSRAKHARKVAGELKAIRSKIHEEMGIAAVEGISKIESRISRCLENDASILEAIDKCHEDVKEILVEVKGIKSNEDLIKLLDLVENIDKKLAVAEMKLLEREDKERMEHAIRLLELGEAKAEARKRGRGGLNRTQLHLAMENNCPIEKVEALLALYPDAAKEKDSWGNFPLHCGMRWRAPAACVMAVLKAYPAAASGVSKSGSTPLHYGIRFKAPLESIHAVLNEHSGAATMKDQAGYTPLDYAKRGNWQGSTYQQAADVLERKLAGCE